MRTGLKSLTSALAAGADAATIGIAPVTMADPAPAQQTVAANSMDAGHLVQTGFHGGGGFHAGWGGYRGGWYGGPGWGHPRWPWGCQLLRVEWSLVVGGVL